MGKQQRFSRRDFLKFGAVGAAGAAAAGIVGCRIIDSRDISLSSHSHPAATTLCLYYYSPFTFAQYW